MKITQEMWAVGWADFEGLSFPSPMRTGAWIVCANETIAESKRVFPKQKIQRVLVTITPITKKKGKK